MKKNNRPFMILTISGLILTGLAGCTNDTELTGAYGVSTGADTGIVTEQTLAKAEKDDKNSKEDVEATTEDTTEATTETADTDTNTTGTSTTGKNNTANDWLTFKKADRRDWWFHAKGMAGSHVIMECASLEEPPAEDFTDACMIAAVYSKAAERPSAEIDYTLVKNVKKPPESKP